MNESLSFQKSEMLRNLELLGEFKDGKCRRREKIYFLKTSKTGSSTFANILVRFGFKRPGMNYLFGESSDGAMFLNGYYMPFNEESCFMGRDIPNRPKFDISYVHMRYIIYLIFITLYISWREIFFQSSCISRYNKTAIDNVMHPETFKISILRNPYDNFISAWRKEFI